MSKFCPITGRNVVYLDCLDCRDKKCRTLKDSPYITKEEMLKELSKQEEYLRSCETASVFEDERNLYKSRLNTTKAIKKVIKEGKEKYYV